MKNQNNPLPLREAAQQKYNSARSNLLLMLGFTLVNIVLLVIKSNTMFLFSATVPYYALAIGLEEKLLLGPAIIIAVISVAVYFLCWLLSKKQSGWMVAALVLFLIDTVCTAVLFLAAGEVSGITDILIHVWVLYYLIIGVKYGAILKNLPEGEVLEEASFAPTENTEFPQS